jgi:predicted kinase
LVNGAPGSGKSTVAHRLAQGRPLDLALDIDVIKHSLGQWDADMTAAGYQARRLALALVDAQLGTGHDVYLGQFLAKTEFVGQLRISADSHAATFVEVILIADAATLRRRLTHRSADPERPDHIINASFVAADDVPVLVGAIDKIAELRPSAMFVDASGNLDATVERVRRVIAVSH